MLALLSANTPYNRSSNTDPKKALSSQKANSKKRKHPSKNRTKKEEKCKKLCKQQESEVLRKFGVNM